MQNAVSVIIEARRKAMPKKMPKEIIIVSFCRVHFDLLALQQKYEKVLQKLINILRWEKLTIRKYKWFLFPAAARMSLHPNHTE